MFSTSNVFYQKWKKKSKQKQEQRLSYTYCRKYVTKTLYFNKLVYEMPNNANRNQFEICAALFQAGLLERIRRVSRNSAAGLSPVSSIQSHFRFHVQERRAGRFKTEQTCEIQLILKVTQLFSQNFRTQGPPQRLKMRAAP